MGFSGNNRFGGGSNGFGGGGAFGGGGYGGGSGAFGGGGYGSKSSSGIGGGNNAFGSSGGYGGKNSSGAGMSGTIGGNRGGGGAFGCNEDYSSGGKNKSAFGSSRSGDNTSGFGSAKEKEASTPKSQKIETPEKEDGKSVLPKLSKMDTLFKKPKISTGVGEEDSGFIKKKNAEDCEDTAYVEREEEERDEEETAKMEEYVDMKSNKFMYMLAYTIVFFFMPYCTNDAMYGSFHGKQGCRLTLTAVIGNVVLFILNRFILPLLPLSEATMATTGNITGHVIPWIFNGFIIFLCLFGIVSVCIGKNCRLPIIGCAKKEKDM